MIITGAAVGRQWPENIIWRVAAHPFLQHDVAFDLIKRHMARPLNHHLASHFPSKLRQFTVNDHLGHLGPVVAVVDGAGADAVTKRQHGIVFLHQPANPVKLLVKRIFTVVVFHPRDHECPSL